MNRGGIVEGDGFIYTHLYKGDYIIPVRLAEHYKKLLDEINEGLDSPDEDGVE